MSSDTWTSFLHGALPPFPSLLPPFLLQPALSACAHGGYRTVLKRAGLCLRMGKGTGPEEAKGDISLGEGTPCGFCRQMPVQCDLAEAEKSPPPTHTPPPFPLLFSLFSHLPLKTFSPCWPSDSLKCPQ